MAPVAPSVLCRLQTEPKPGPEPETCEPPAPDTFSEAFSRRPHTDVPDRRVWGQCGHFATVEDMAAACTALPHCDGLVVWVDLRDVRSALAAAVSATHEVCV